ncbi:nuclear pore complex protein Nup93-like [Argopecten irradians]|uniref:nuclear pore complex protein Nup93-like n=1 Tax=Argopecten irradians TaxID=31199 RepID=UPI0037197B06
MQGRSSLDNIEAAYARQVFQYNEHIVQGSLRPCLVDMFLDVAKKLDDKHVVDLWEMVKCMVEVPLVSTSSISQTRSDYRTHMAFVDKARDYLESQYTKYITNTIYGIFSLQVHKVYHQHYLWLFLITGTQSISPTSYMVISLDRYKKYVTNTIYGYFSLQVHKVYHQHHIWLFLITGTQSILPTPYMVTSNRHSWAESQDETVDGHPTWAMIYYCLRCGDLQAAQQVVDKAAYVLQCFTYTKICLFTTNESNRIFIGLSGGQGYLNPSERFWLVNPRLTEG